METPFWKHNRLVQRRANARMSRSDFLNTLLAFQTMVLIAAGVTIAQDRPPGNPREADPASVPAENAAAETAQGNTGSGERIFWTTCGSCHAVNGRGGRLGPDLSRIALTRPPEALSGAIRLPTASTGSAYQAVTLVTRDGQRIRGARKSEDAFSIQIMDTHEQLRGYLKASLREVIHDPGSLMPAFGPDRLSDRDLDEVVAFLNTLRGSGPGPSSPGRGRGR
jgi:putative heme-binding domain-containing protein